MTLNMSVTLNDDLTMPRLGYGVWQINNSDVGRLVQAALEIGYRSIDTAMIYGNEEGVGNGIRAWSGPREDLFITTKVWNSDHGSRACVRACEESLARLGLDYVDLYLIHWPIARVGKYVETWEALVRLRDRGLVRSIGVSNFQSAHLDAIINATGVAPAVNQIELHPWLQQAELRGVHSELGIATEAWSPLGAGGELLADPLVGRVAEEVGRSPAQVILRWHLQLGNVVIPKSADLHRMAENFDVESFSLSETQVAELGTLDCGRRLGPDPDMF
jgi:2,5-diketo-D-gluconate reductase A